MLNRKTFGFWFFSLINRALCTESWGFFSCFPCNFMEYGPSRVLTSILAPAGSILSIQLPWDIFTESFTFCMIARSYLRSIRFTVKFFQSRLRVTNNYGFERRILKTYILKVYLLFGERLMNHDKRYISHMNEIDPCANCVLSCSR